MKNFLKILFAGVILMVVNSVQAQNPTFRLGFNSGWFQRELGPDDEKFPLLDLLLPENNLVAFEPDIRFGIEGEILLPLSSKSFIGVEFESVRFSGSNNDATLYNFLFTPYNAIDTFVLAPYAYKTAVINMLASYRYYLSKSGKVSPFVKIASGVSFVGTEFFFKDEETAFPFSTNILYSRGTPGSENIAKNPAFAVGAGIGFDYQIADNVFLEFEGSAKTIKSDIVDGVPNFTYLNEEGKDILKHRERQSLTFQVSASICYSLDSGMEMDSKMKKTAGRSTGRSGKTNSHLPFYRKK